MFVRLFLVLCMLVSSARADAVDEPQPIVGFRVEGSKLASETLGYLMRVEIGDRVSTSDIAELERALVSSELFKTVEVHYEPAPSGGVIVVGVLRDKHSWIVMPTAYLLASNWAAGLGFAENNLFGENKKLLLYAQIGEINSFFIGAYVVPSVRGSKLSLRFDTYLQRRIYDEYANPSDDRRSVAFARSSDHLFLNGGVAAGWNHRWWLKSEGRFRGAAIRYTNPHVPDEPGVPIATPSKNGRDVTVQGKVTLDRRDHDRGVSDGPYAQLTVELPVPALSTYLYAAMSARAFFAKRVFSESQIELRTYANVGYHMPFHDEWTMGGAGDLRGYNSEQFRGDVRALARLEYSVPIARVSVMSFRALGFFDSGVIGFHFTDPSVRSYLPEQVGRNIFRNDVGAGIRIYVSNIVLPLLGLDVGYGLESHSPTLYFQVGLTDL
jgi:outer membrane protein insertion porin family